MTNPEANKKLRYSRQRERIYDYLCSVEDHPSAEMIYEALRPEMPHLSLGTVYRNLKVLEEIGKVIRVTSIDHHERYDAICEAHAHFICDKCGRVIDLLDVDMEAVKDACCLPDNTLPQQVGIVIGGICSQCPKGE